MLMSAVVNTGSLSLSTAYDAPEHPQVYPDYHNLQCDVISVADKDQDGRSITVADPAKHLERMIKAAAKMRKLLMKMLNIVVLAKMVTGGQFVNRNMRSLALAALLLALSLELLGWFIMTGLFVTFLLYLLLIIHS
ncbi:hypothetical protein CPB83DRAFT_861382 [Crepidotus variabilis]|uniref:Uncharacterized protein n=1 Tax=Crepidotus variabilis TaxID=179855 RepID=A0A9P6E8K2_9AGAR|nr:hypothetical protein CPB83DRAFT_861382 [Crepidotus variabilis]